jgi:hypothetical protein
LKETEAATQKYHAKYYHKSSPFVEFNNGIDDFLILWIKLAMISALNYRKAKVSIRMVKVSIENTDLLKRINEIMNAG